MADYLPLVERLVSKLPSDDADARSFAYQRARRVLEGQFGDDVPAGDRLAIERAALEDAISRVEASFAEPREPDAGPAPPDTAARDDSAPPPRPDAGAPQRGSGATGEPRAARASPPRARRARGVVLSAMVAASLGVVLVGVSLAAWRAFHHRGRLAAPAETMADDGGRGTTGVDVPPPVGEASLTGSDSGAAVATVQRAALLVDAPKEPQRLKAYVGTVAWRLARVGPGSGAGQPATSEIHADIRIPEAGLTVDVSFAKNAASELPASHTVEIRFLPQPGSPVGSIDQVDLPEMRDDDAPTGARLSGMQAKVTDGHFLFGLSRGAAEAQNLQLMQTRPWFDVPVLLSSHKVAKLTFEKGATGAAVWGEALGDWRQTAGVARISADGPRR